MNAGFHGALALAATAMLAAMPASAQQSGGLTSKIELEKPVPAANGAPAAKTYVEPDVVVPGDRIRVTLTFSNNSAAPATGLDIVNPIPVGLVYDGTDDTADFSVSVDGGKTFGPLPSLSLSVANAAPRAATMTDVTHVRWRWSTAVGPEQKRSVAFFGRVK